MVDKRYNLLDIIKGLMILFIIVTHFRFSYPEDYQRYGFFYWIDMAVPVFMIITGYLTALNLRKKNINSLKKAWSVDVIFPKILRYMIPFIPVFLCEALVMMLFANESIADVIMKLLREGGVRTR